ncbi:MAG: ATP-binding cassette domain-containing protein [Methanolobus sp.]|nr:ATP-binding cassette domain-containing protein [Methanolobus sp.]
MFAITVENLTKEFGNFTAVNGLSFNIEQGEVFGLLGPNGAGKTTTMSMLSTMLKPSCGKASVNGYDILNNEDEVRRSIGIVFQDQSLDEELTAYENMDFHGRLYRLDKGIRKKRIIELLELVELADKKENLVKTYSGGMRRRLEIARGLLHEPKVLFLDEPTLGLDPQTRNHLWDYIEKLSREKGITIILTTHYMEEADKLCNRIAIIDKGSIIALGTSDKLKKDVGVDIIKIVSSEKEKLWSAVSSMPGIKNIEIHDDSLTIGLKDAEKHVVKIINMAYSRDIPIGSISIHKPTLEDVFLHFTGRTIREEEASGKEQMRMMRRLRR